MADFSVIPCPITKRKYDKCFSNLLRFLQMTSNCFAVQSSVGKFRNSHFRCENFIGRSSRNMFSHLTTVMEILNPRVCVKNETFHKQLFLGECNITVGGAFLIAMFHHLIELFTLCRFRP